MTRVLTSVGASLSSAAKTIGWRSAGLFAAGALLISAWWWAPPVLGELSYFQVRGVRVEGARYVDARDIWKRLALDSAMSVWDELAPLEQRIASHPQVRSVDIGRKLPDTLVIRITENQPIALVPKANGMEVVDGEGRVLPIDPSKIMVDLPVLSRVDTAATRVLADLRRDDPALFERISDVRPAGRGELVFHLGDYAVRAMRDVTAGRFADIIPVEADLARRGARVEELDIRFREQVIVRVQ
ncbi:MAG TPA: FtsQ-type POTRA domain-containing protein [Gemmatimonadaceae bacterium]|nr:FtsQ-type POTRA domain-containing protein [Gemmatimonadaceae bacterium]